MTDDEFDAAVQAALDRNGPALKGQYRKQIAALLGISGEQLRAIEPNQTLSAEAYNNLISIVKEASRGNIAQARLEEKIAALGSVAVDIARLVGFFA